MEEKKQTNDLFQEEINNASLKINEIINEIHKKVVWQDKLIKNLLIWLFWKWHILLEWVPWLAKTLTVNTLSQTLSLWFNRIQFTPDLLPSDLIWTEIYNSKKAEFDIKKWPVFNNFILADEINRAPSKVQSALLEAMAEKHITIWNHTFNLENPFIVLATQNPIEQSGTYKLPEAQLDRFMMKTLVDYPSLEQEKEMYKKLNSKEYNEVKKIVNSKDIFKIQNLVKDIYVSENIFDYITNIIDASRNPQKYGLENIKEYINYWISPRWWLSLIAWAKVSALMDNRTFVIPEDIKDIALDTLSHRIVLTYAAIADDINDRDLIKMIIDNVKVV